MAEDTINKPNGQSSQTFYFTSWNHMTQSMRLVKKHKKRERSLSLGKVIARVPLCDPYIHEVSIASDYGRFVISGKPKAVDALMLEIRAVKTQYAATKCFEALCADAVGIAKHNMP